MKMRIRRGNPITLTNQQESVILEGLRYYEATNPKDFILALQENYQNSNTRMLSVIYDSDYIFTVLFDLEIPNNLTLDWNGSFDSNITENIGNRLLCPFNVRELKEFQSHFSRPIYVIINGNYCFISINKISNLTIEDL